MVDLDTLTNPITHARSNNRSELAGSEICQHVSFKKSERVGVNLNYFEHSLQLMAIKGIIYSS